MFIFQNKEYKTLSSKKTAETKYFKNSILKYNSGGDSLNASKAKMGYDKLLMVRKIEYHQALFSEIKKQKKSLKTLKSEKLKIKTKIQ